MHSGKMISHRSPMEEALAKKKSQGIDLTITIGSSDKSKEAQKTSDLAPPGAHPPSDPHDLTSPGLEHLAATDPDASTDDTMSTDPTDPDLDDTMTQGMSDYDKHHLALKDPKSMTLGERARFAALKRKKV